MLDTSNVSAGSNIYIYPVETLIFEYFSILL